MLAEAVIEAGTMQSVTVGDFDGVDVGLVQRTGDVPHVFQGVLMADGVAAIAQGHVGDVDFLVWIEAHGASPQPLFMALFKIDCAMRSAVASAADVIMS